MRTLCRTCSRPASVSLCLSQQADEGRVPTAAPDILPMQDWTHTGRKSPTQGHTAPQRRALTLEGPGPSPAGKVKGGTSSSGSAREGLQFSMVGSPCHAYLILQCAATLGLTTPLARGVLNTKRTPANLSLPFLGTALSMTASHSPQSGGTDGVPTQEDVPCSLVPDHQQHSLQPWWDLERVASVSADGPLCPHPYPESGVSLAGFSVRVPFPTACPKAHSEAIGAVPRDGCTFRWDLQWLLLGRTGPAWSCCPLLS